MSRAKPLLTTARHASLAPSPCLPSSVLPVGRYVVGDSRFQRYCKSNPRKMVKLWAEKEMRNLARLHAAGIPSPKPLQLRMHVLGELLLQLGGCMCVPVALCGDAARAGRV